MSKRSPYDIIQHRYVTEKAKMLEGLQHSSSNKCVKKCTTPKAVFIVDKWANKIEIAQAVEEIFSKQQVKVIAVNTSIIKPRIRNMRRKVGRVGRIPGFKKAIVTFQAGCGVDDNG